MKSASVIEISKSKLRDNYRFIRKFMGKKSRFSSVVKGNAYGHGIEAFKEIRGFSNTPVIMVTTEAEKKRIIECIKAGINNYVIKPFKAEVLVQKIKETLESVKS